MPRGIAVLGLNGSGKTTLGRALAEALGWQRLDVEDYYFLDPARPFEASRTRAEVQARMEADIRARGDFVLSSVHGDWGEEIVSQYVLAVLLAAPLDVRLERIGQRERARFGARVAAGGDLCENERTFRAFVAARDPLETERRAEALPCPLLRLDGARPVLELVYAVQKAIKEWIA